MSNKILGREHTVDQCIRSLSRKHDVRIIGYQIQILLSDSKKAIHDLGNGSWGRIDFLVKKGYSRFFTESF